MKNKEEYLREKAYLECGLPEYLQEDIDALLEGERVKSSLLDALSDEVYGSINSAYYNNLIDEEQAQYLREKYLFKGDE